MNRREFLATPALFSTQTKSTRPGIALNEDNSHFYFTRAGRTLDAAAVDSLIDQYAGTQIRELMLCPNSMRTSYASKVWDPVWRGYDPQGPDNQPLFAGITPEAAKGIRRWIHTAWELDQKGIDPYQRWIKRCRKHAISPWISMRMNDIHEVNNERSPMHSEFWRKNPQFRRVPYREGFRERAFDYGHAEVREYHMALVRELIERYDFDGLELDWMRFAFHFRPGQEARGADLLTDFTRQVRTLLRQQEKRRGHRIKLGARVPSRPHTAAGLGMDGVRWAREGLVDMLVVTPFFSSAEFDMPIELWKQLLRGTGVTLAAGLEILVRPNPEMTPPPHMSLETARGAAASLLDRGADRIYLFNYMDSETAIEDLDNYRTLLSEVGDPATLAGKPRRHVLTFADTWAPGEPAAPPQLPLKCGPGKWSAFRLATGPKPAPAPVSVRLGIDGSSSGWEVRLNGELCTAAGTVTPSHSSPGKPLSAFRAPEAAVVRGYNLVEVRAASEATIFWVEVMVG